ncbi:transposase family protein [Streptomyces sp. NPDC050287]|uniref:transposase family protein n=1 Tax=Streptomyces sp. NPDC050287 TaxID=3365608 RepID=UPI0037B025B3
MPAAPSFPIPAVLAKLAPHQHDTGRLRAHLQRVPDPRSRRGRWYPVLGLLLICACAVVSGARTITEITEWGQRASNGVLEELGIRRHLPGRRRAPSKATLTRLLAALDGRTLQQHRPRAGAGAGSAPGLRQQGATGAFTDAPLGTMVWERSHQWHRGDQQRGSPHDDRTRRPGPDAAWPCCRHRCTDPFRPIRPARAVTGVRAA